MPSFFLPAHRGPSFSLRSLVASCPRHPPLTASSRTAGASRRQVCTRARDFPVLRAVRPLIGQGHRYAASAQSPLNTSSPQPDLGRNSPFIGLIKVTNYAPQDWQ
ncbi:hypothetical protein TSMEX_002078 [Taenia solium]|eukprot:TsM_000823400 transcript=TsM_000823400 gene=TsM_000823400